MRLSWMKHTVELNKSVICNALRTKRAIFLPLHSFHEKYYQIEIVFNKRTSKNSDLSVEEAVGLLRNFIFVLYSDFEECYCFVAFFIFLPTSTSVRAFIVDGSCRVLLWISSELTRFLYDVSCMKFSYEGDPKKQCFDACIWDSVSSARKCYKIVINLISSH